MNEPTDTPLWIEGDLALIASTLAKELHQQGLLSPPALTLISAALARLANAFQDHDPTDPLGKDAAATHLNSVALLLQRAPPPSSP